MTDRELERQLRDYFRAEGRDEHASQDLLARINAIAEAPPVASPQIHRAWLLAAAVLLMIALLGVAFGAGSSLLPRNPLFEGAVPTLTTATTAATTPGLTAVPTNTVATAHIDVDGVTRDYTVVAPPDAANRGPLPLLVLMHRGNIATSEARVISGTDKLARDPGAVLVWAEAYQTSWNFRATVDGPDDVAFIRALIDHLAADYPVDPNRVFLLGDGTGGAMAYRAACELSDRFAAVAVVSLDAELLVGEDCTLARPISVLDIYGSDDTVTLSDGGATGCDGPCPTVAQTMERWRQADGCTGEPTTTTEGIVDTTTFSTCGAGAEVQFVKANGLNDTWLGPGIDDLALIWAFLTNHARSAGSTG